jgi:hypothetical protein
LTSDPQKKKRASAPAARIGRGVASALFWISALYLAAVGFWSIPRQVFGPQASPAPPATSCERGLDDLRSEMRARAAEHVAEGGAVDLDEVRRWLESWDRRHAALAPVCDGAGSEAHRVLGVMRHRTEDALRRNAREQAPLERALARALDRLPDSSRTEP